MNRMLCLLCQERDKHRVRDRSDAYLILKTRQYAKILKSIVGWSRPLPVRVHLLEGMTKGETLGAVRFLKNHGMIEQKGSTPKGDGMYIITSWGKCFLGCTSRLKLKADLWLYYYNSSGLICMLGAFMVVYGVVGFPNLPGSGPSVFLGFLLMGWWMATR